MHSHMQAHLGISHTYLYTYTLSHPLIHSHMHNVSICLYYMHAFCSTPTPSCMHVLYTPIFVHSLFHSSPGLSSIALVGHGLTDRGVVQGKGQGQEIPFHPARPPGLCVPLGMFLSVSGPQSPNNNNQHLLSMPDMLLSKTHSSLADGKLRVRKRKPPAKVSQAITRRPGVQTQV